MAKRSKTQQAKASAKRAAKRAAAEESLNNVAEVSENIDEAVKKAEPKKSETKPVEKKKAEKAKPKKQHFAFLKEVKQELKRVTWPSRKDVIQWSGVVVAALLFFGIFVALLDNLVVTPSLVAVSSIEVDGVDPEDTSDSSTDDTTASGDTSADSGATAEGDGQTYSLDDIQNMTSDGSTTDSSAASTESTETPATTEGDSSNEENTSEGSN